MSKRVRTLYLCDPEKNTVCNKSYCAHHIQLVISGDQLRCEKGECEETFNINFAKLNERGEPIVMGRFVDKEETNEERST